MPTVGWIREGDLERFFAATSSIPDPAPAKAPRHYCPFCHATFETNRQLGQHLVSDHIGGRPFVTFGGREPPSEEVVRTHLSPSEVAFFNTTTVKISFDKSIYIDSPNEAVAEALASASEQRIWLRLENIFETNAAPIRTEYGFDFKIYRADQLAVIDKLFVERLSRPDPTVPDVDGFLRDARRVGADEYADALADYVLAVLIKDGDTRAGIRPGERDYRRKYNSALRVLKHFDRPLARLLSALIRFSSNDFNTIARTAFLSLDFANARLAPLTGKNGEVSQQASAIEGEEILARADVCPVDNGSDAVMRRADQLAALKRWSADIEDEIRSAVQLASLDPLDRVKIFALWADTTIQLQRPEAAVEPLRMLVGNDCFGAWAEGKLQEYGA